MATIGPLYTRSFNPVWSFVDLTGLQCDDTFYLYVLQNTVPYIPAPVYNSPTGNPWTNPIQLLANGTLPLDVYWDPTMTYRLELRQNIGPLPPSQADPLIYLIENYVPPEGGVTPIDTEGVFTDNQISNAQFSEINFGTSFTLTGVANPAPIEVAPDWFLNLAGNGTAVVSRLALNDALANPTNAPYALRITLTGAWTGVPYLSQRLQQNGMLWANKYVSTSLTARIENTPQSISINLYASNGQPLAVLLNAALTNTFEEYMGHNLLPNTLNPDVPPDAYIEYRLLLPTNGDVYVTSFQLIASNSDVNVTYQQDTIDRQIDHLFHYYNPQLQYKPIPSYLIGWDFPLNPAQLGAVQGPVDSGANTAAYVWDQTIIFQTANNAFATIRDANGSLKITSAAMSQIALVQYLEQAQARKILNDRASVHLSLYGNVVGGASGNVTLWATTDTNLPTLPTCFFSGLDANGIPTGPSGAWVQVPNVYQNTGFTVPAISATNAESNDISLNGWDEAGAAIANAATFFAIVVGFTPWASADTLNFNSVGLCAGDIATRPAPLTPILTQLQCQTYYFQTFANGTTPVNNFGLHTGEFVYPATRLTIGAQYSNSLFYPVTMRTNPSIVYFNPGASGGGEIYDEIAPGSGGMATTVNNTKSSLTFFADGNANTAIGNPLGVHIVADARLGIIN